MYDTQFGADPEIFVVDKDGNCIPPAALREDFGLKYLDEKTLINGDGWSIIEDGAATEINFMPSDDENTIFERIENAITGISKFIKDKFDLETIIFPTVPFDVKKYWNNRGEEFRDCVRFGCDPALDIYSGEFSTEISADDIPERYGGGHIHMQAPENNMGLFDETYYHATILMDILVGNSGVAFMRPNMNWIKAEKSRLKYYGRPGKIRLQEYPNGMKGIEYRTPSNFWITNPLVGDALLTLMNTVFNLTKNPTDASKFLESELPHLAPKNILNFDQTRAFNIFCDALDKLGSMRYLSYDKISSLVNLCK